MPFNCDATTIRNFVLTALRQDDPARLDMVLDPLDQIYKGKLFSFIEMGRLKLLEHDHEKRLIDVELWFWQAVQAFFINCLDGTRVDILPGVLQKEFLPGSLYALRNEGQGTYNINDMLFVLIAADQWAALRVIDKEQHCEVVTLAPEQNAFHESLCALLNQYQAKQDPSVLQNVRRQLQAPQNAPLFEQQVIVEGVLPEQDPPTPMLDAFRGTLRTMTRLYITHQLKHVDCIPAETTIIGYPADSRRVRGLYEEKLYEVIQQLQRDHFDIFQGERRSIENLRDRFRRNIELNQRKREPFNQQWFFDREQLILDAPSKKLYAYQCEEKFSAFCEALRLDPAAKEDDDLYTLFRKQLLSMASIWRPLSEEELSFIKSYDTVLHVAMRFGAIRCIQYLLRPKSRPHKRLSALQIQNSEGEEPLWMIHLSSGNSLLHLCVRAGIKSDVLSDPFVNVQLSAALAHREWCGVRLPLNLMNRNGETPLTIRDAEGNTLLHQIFKYIQKKMYTRKNFLLKDPQKIPVFIAELFAAGADLNAENHFGETPLQLLKKMETCGLLCAPAPLDERIFDQCTAPQAYVYAYHPQNPYLKEHGEEKLFSKKGLEHFYYINKTTRAIEEVKELTRTTAEHYTRKLKMVGYKAVVQIERPLDPLSQPMDPRTFYVIKHDSYLMVYWKSENPDEVVFKFQAIENAQFEDVMHLLPEVGSVSENEHLIRRMAHGYDLHLHPIACDQPGELKPCNFYLYFKNERLQFSAVSTADGVRTTMIERSECPAQFSNIVSALKTGKKELAKPARDAFWEVAKKHGYPLIKMGNDAYDTLFREERLLSREEMDYISSSMGHYRTDESSIFQSDLVHRASKHTLQKAMALLENAPVHILNVDSKEAGNLLIEDIQTTTQGQQWVIVREQEISPYQRIFFTARALPQRPEKSTLYIQKRYEEPYSLELRYLYDPLDASIKKNYLYCYLRRDEIWCAARNNRGQIDRFPVLFRKIPASFDSIRTILRHGEGTLDAEQTNAIFSVAALRGYSLRKGVSFNVYVDHQLIKTLDESEIIFLKRLRHHHSIVFQTDVPLERERGQLELAITPAALNYAFLLREHRIVTGEIEWPALECRLGSALYKTFRAACDAKNIETANKFLDTLSLMLAEREQVPGGLVEFFEGYKKAILCTELPLEPQSGTLHLKKGVNQSVEPIQLYPVGRPPILLPNGDIQNIMLKGLHPSVMHDDFTVETTISETLRSLDERLATDLDYTAVSIDREDHEKIFSAIVSLISTIQTMAYLISDGKILRSQAVPSVLQATLPGTDIVLVGAEREAFMRSSGAFRTLSRELLSERGHYLSEVERVTYHQTGFFLQKLGVEEDLGVEEEQALVPWEPLFTSPTWGTRLTGELSEPLFKQWLVEGLVRLRRSVLYNYHRSYEEGIRDQLRVTATQLVRTFPNGRFDRLRVRDFLKQVLVSLDFKDPEDPTYNRDGYEEKVRKEQLAEEEHRRKSDKAVEQRETAHKKVERCSATLKDVNDDVELQDENLEAEYAQCLAMQDALEVEYQELVRGVSPFLSDEIITRIERYAERVEYFVVTLVSDFLKAFHIYEEKRNLEREKIEFRKETQRQREEAQRREEEIQRQRTEIEERERRLKAMEAQYGAFRFFAGHPAADQTAQEDTPEAAPAASAAAAVPAAPEAMVPGNNVEVEDSEEHTVLVTDAQDPESHAEPPEGELHHVSTPC